jgi:hypothetical protein
MSNIEKNFKDFHKNNPDIFDLFTQYAKEIRAAGFERYSANAIFERIRWHKDIQTSGDRFKMNNNYRAFYARKLMKEDPSFQGFFAIRTQRFK